MYESFASLLCNLDKNNLSTITVSTQLLEIRKKTVVRDKEITRKSVSFVIDFRFYDKYTFFSQTMNSSVRINQTKLCTLTRQPPAGQNINTQNRQAKIS